MSEPTTITPLDEPIRYRTIHDVELALEELLPESEFSPAQLSRIATVAREKHVDRRAQVIAVLDAAAQEAAEHPPAAESPALKALEQFRAEYEPQLEIEDGMPAPWLEKDRPHWSDPSLDNPSVTYPAGALWISKPLNVPSHLHDGVQHADGTTRSASVGVSLAQHPSEREPYVWVDRMIWSDGKLLYRNPLHLRLDEAAALARGLLLLVDAAREEV